MPEYYKTPCSGNITFVRVPAMIEIWESSHGGVNSTSLLWLYRINYLVRAKKTGRNKYWIIICCHNIWHVNIILCILT